MNLKSEVQRGESAGECGGPRRLRRFSLREVWSLRALSAWWTLKRPEGRAPAVAHYSTSGFGMNGATPFRFKGPRECCGPRRLRRFSLRKVWILRALSARWTLKRPEGRAPVVAHLSISGFG
jgi:hypothetical protein